jgi:hypothetical protein
MLRNNYYHESGRRRGVILLVVITLLSLFAIVGLAFVMYANTEANASSAYRQSFSVPPTSIDIQPDLLLNYSMAQLIYDVPDDNTGVGSAMRGHSMARNMYGWNYDATIAAPNVNTTAGTNIIPFNGIGRLHLTNSQLAGGDDDFKYPNYTYFQSDNFLRDPERYYAGATSGQIGTRASPSAPLGSYFGFNAPYTYPDLNCMFLGAVKSDGTLLVQSFHRPWIFSPGSATGLSDTGNSNWTNAQGKYLILRPRTHEMDSTFLPPADGNGDVKNLIGASGGNDSVWLDLGYPVTIAADGTKFKPLFAFFVLDLDNRINLNVTGNIKGASNTQASNQGWGPWEINFRQLIKSSDSQLATKQTELANIFLGSPPASNPPTYKGRYGNNRQPGDTTQDAASLKTPKIYGQVDFDGYNATGSALTVGIGLPLSGGAIFPTFPPGYDNCTGGAGPPAGEQYQHPLKYDFFNPKGNNTASPYDDIAFDISNMKQLLYDGFTGNDYQNSALYSLCPTSFGDTAPFPAMSPTTTLGSILRHQVTTHSFDVDRPGVIPWVWDPTASTGKYTLAAPNPPPAQAGAFYPSGPQSSFPTTGGTNKPGDSLNANSEFQADWRAQMPYATAPGQSLSPPFPGLGRVDLNRPLPDYPAEDSTTGIINLTAADPTGVYTTNQDRFTAAEQARQQMAADILVRFQAASASPAGGDDNANRWLAQLAVNIVDYIDSDSIMTPFYWKSANGQGSSGDPVVYGTELPRLVINEAYSEFDNGYTVSGSTVTMDPLNGMTTSNGMTGATLPYSYNFWVELLNPLQTTGGNLYVTGTNSPSDDGSARLKTTGMGGYSIYNLAITAIPPTGLTSSNLRGPANVLGDPDSTARLISDYTPFNTPSVDSTKVLALNGNWNGPSGKNQGFYMMGPPLPFPSQAAPPPAPPIPQATLQITPSGTNNYNSMSVADPASPMAPTAAPPLVGFNSTNLYKYTLLLRRLACPGLPPSATNPYVTVDYVENVPSYSGVTNDINGPIAMAQQTPIANRRSKGRTQPYAADGTQQMDQNPTPTALVSQPQHTFFQHNFIDPSSPPNPATPAQTLRTPFDWLVHLDRQVVSPIELLQVSGFKPHELTQQFVSLPYVTASKGAVSPGAVDITPLSYTSTTATTIQGFNNMSQWTITGSTKLRVDPGPNAEDVLVNSVSGSATPPTFNVTFSKPHAAGFPIVLQPASVTISPLPSNFGHRAPWFDQSARLFRALEFLETGNRAAGIGVGGRIPGKVNINTIWDPEVFLAVCDAQASSPNPNYFTTTDVTNIFNNMISSRSPGGTLGPTSLAVSGFKTNRPFLGLACPFTPTTGDQQYPHFDPPYVDASWGGSGIDDTLFRAPPPSAPPPAGNPLGRLFDVPNPTPTSWPDTGTPQQAQSHPYIQTQLLSKIYNNITTRSNVFGVWLTVGFFQVTDGTTQPVKLGAEINLAQNLNIRHRMFCIVDRSNLNIAPGQSLTTLKQAVTADPTKPQMIQVDTNAVTVSANSLSGTTSPTPPSVAMPWMIQAGSTIVVDTGANQEIVVVRAVDGQTDPTKPTITGTFIRNHPYDSTKPTPVTIPGNPGPQPLFDANDQKYAPVVPYSTILN